MQPNMFLSFYNKILTKHNIEKLKLYILVFVKKKTITRNS